MANIWLTDWHIETKGGKRTVKDIVCSGETPEEIAADPTNIKRLERELRLKIKYKIVSVELKTSLGKTN